MTLQLQILTIPSPVHCLDGFGFCPLCCYFLPTLWVSVISQVIGLSQLNDLCNSIFKLIVNLRCRSKIVVNVQLWQHCLKIVLTDFSLFVQLGNVCFQNFDQSGVSMERQNGVCSVNFVMLKNFTVL